MKSAAHSPAAFTQRSRRPWSRNIVLEQREQETIAKSELQMLLD